MHTAIDSAFSQLMLPDHRRPRLCVAEISSMLHWRTTEGAYMTCTVYSMHGIQAQCIRRAAGRPAKGDSHECACRAACQCQVLANCRMSGLITECHRVVGVVTQVSTLLAKVAAVVGLKRKHQHLMQYAQVWSAERSMCEVLKCPVTQWDKVDSSEVCGKPCNCASAALKLICCFNMPLQSCITSCACSRALGSTER